MILPHLDREEKKEFSLNCEQFDLRFQRSVPIDSYQVLPIENGEKWITVFSNDISKEGIVEWMSTSRLTELGTSLIT